MKIDDMSRGFCVRLLLLLVLDLVLSLFTVNVAHTQDEVGSKDGPGTVVAQAPVDKQPAKADATAMAESSAAGGDFEFDPCEPINEKMFLLTVRFSTDLCSNPWQRPGILFFLPRFRREFTMYLIILQWCGGW